MTEPDLVERGKRDPATGRPLRKTGLVGTQVQQSRRVRSYLTAELRLVLEQGGRPEFAAQVDGLVEQLRAEWQIREVGLPFANGLSGAIFPVALADGRAAVLKLAPGSVSLAGEQHYLQAAAGLGIAPALYARSQRANALLLELIPTVAGAPLWPAGTSVRAQAFETWQLLETIGTLPSAGLQDQAARIGYLQGRICELGERFAIPASLLALAEQGAQLALATAAALPLAQRRFCHGDLWNPNLLRAADGRLLALDPQPCQGDPAADLAYVALNVGLEDKPDRDLFARLSLYGEVAGIEFERLLAWTAFYASRKAARSFTLTPALRTELCPAWAFVAGTALLALEIEPATREVHVAAAV